MDKKLLVAVTTLVGFVVGAGILGMPFVFAKAGFITGVVSVLLIGFAIMLQNLMIGETSLRTKKNHQLVGYAEKYLGKKGKTLMLWLLLIGWYSAMIAYIIKTGEFLSVLLAPIIFLPPIVYSIVFALIGTYLVLKGLKLIEKSEFWMIIITLITVVVIGIFAFPSIESSNLTGFNMNLFWFPFGVVLFAFGGAGAIPEMREELKKNAKLLKNAIIIGTAISAILYIIFPLFVVGVTGPATTDGAIIGLGGFLGYKMLLIGSFFGILTMSTSFLVIGLAIKEIFKFDYNSQNVKSTTLACAIPFIAALSIILLKIDNAFYRVIDFSGAIIYPLTSILFVFMFWNARKHGERKPEYAIKHYKLVGLVVAIIFLLGFINAIIRLLS